MMSRLLSMLSKTDNDSEGRCMTKVIDSLTYTTEHQRPRQYRLSKAAERYFVGSCHATDKSTVNNEHG